MASSMKTLITLLFVLTFAASAEEQAAAGLSLKDGDTLVFLGDSITHQCLYTQYLEDFFYTRFPDRRIRFHNAGVSGDKAADALARFDDDVAAHQPRFVTVLLGMNDGGYEDLGAGSFGSYTRDMTALLDRIAAIGATPLVMSPTMFDHHQLALKMEDPEYRFRTRSFHPNYNAVLAYFGGWLREEAGSRKLDFVDQWAPMNQHTFSKRRLEPDFTLVPDAIHPAPAGHFLMAFELLSRVSPERKNVSSISIVPAAKGLRGNAGVSELEVSSGRDRVSFTHLADALPWVVPSQAWEGEMKWDDEPGAAVGYAMTAAGHKLSNERLRVAGLASGTYEIKIDGVSVGTWSHLALAAKVELQSNEKTPQYRQAIDVAMLNRERNDEAIRPMRDLWAKVKGLRNKDGVDFAKEYAALKPQIEALHVLAGGFEDRIYAAARPQPRKYEIVRVP